ncbi:MAG: 8-oxo-dGTP diphosphatase [Nanoarchaeota archaeon]|nr:8-oxo-dGTP diphosphatase [Nanoarchaeota archaeon]MBU1445428.1 8-oxo-dGTP diphosphatase [Nanoarchaeota archaeon]MBU2420236.1 8-oxo-dGTP diphosphatase [Nanoarchaeota archaeon]MBU2475001.1 8-oxo-dGTP diphosphatase [Nanoarchaeota archaeon]
MTRIETVATVYRHPRILLGKKINNKFGAGKYNGFGGGIEDDDEDIFATAIRETEEEAGITLINPDRMGRILFRFQSDEQDHDVHFFRARKYLGTPRETDEMIFRWFNINNIPYDQMWPSDRYWFPLLLEGTRFLGEVLFGSDQQVIEHILKGYEDRESFEDALRNYENAILI